MSDPPRAAGDTPPGSGRAEPLAGEVSRTRVVAPPPGPPDPPPAAGTPVPPFIAALDRAVPGAIDALTYWVGDWTVVVAPARLLDAARHLRDAPGAAFDFCADVTATDWPPRPQRFDIIYALYSTTLRHRVRLKLRAGEQDAVPSVSAIWPAANWLEREVYDLFGVRFEGHPDLRRILMPDDWQGHPQRKDYPLEGPGELLLESPADLLKVQQARETE